VHEGGEAAHAANERELSRDGISERHQSAGALELLPGECMLLPFQPIARMLASRWGCEAPARGVQQLKRLIHARADETLRVVPTIGKQCSSAGFTSLGEAERTLTDSAIAGDAISGKSAVLYCSFSASSTSSMVPAYTRALARARSCGRVQCGGAQLQAPAPHSPSHQYCRAERAVAPGARVALALPRTVLLPGATEVPAAVAASAAGH